MEEWKGIILILTADCTLANKHSPVRIYVAGTALVQGCNICVSRI